MVLIEGYTKNESYPWIEEYTDELYCTVNEKTVEVPDLQRAVTSDHNSQYLPFIMGRYYDGVDLSEKTFKVAFMTSSKVIGKLDVINFQYDENNIVFGTLLANAATSGTGTLAIQVEITGTNSISEPYKWVSEVNKQIKVLESIDESEGWENEEIISARQQILLNKAAITELGNRVKTLEENPSGGVSYTFQKVIFGGVDNLVITPSTGDPTRIPLPGGVTKADVDEATSGIKEDLNRLKNSDHSATGKVWTATDTGAGWADAPSGGGVSEDRVNELIDAKLSPLEALADDVLGVI